ncbi:MAG: YraN family protein [Anaerolineaceae bacterium]
MKKIEDGEMKPHFHNQKTGRWGEHLAEEFLIGKGFSPVGRNIRTESGEIDLILEKNNLLIFVEVKTRTGLGFGFPEESVTETKSEHFLAAVEEYLGSNPADTKEWRIDVVAITGSEKSRDRPVIEWFEDAFS